MKYGSFIIGIAFGVVVGWEAVVVGEGVGLEGGVGGGVGGGGGGGWGVDVVGGGEEEGGEVCGEFLFHTHTHTHTSRSIRKSSINSRTVSIIIHKFRRF